MQKNENYLKNEIQGRHFDAFPLPWGRLFGRKAPLSVEIGFGNGQFLYEMARQRPEENFVGIELSLESARRLLKLSAETGCSNIRTLRENAGFALRELFAPASLHHVIMNFPDPWPKERHQKRRLISPQFVQTLSAVLEKEGCYELVTDQSWYAQEAYGLFAVSGLFRLKKVETNPERPVQTKYEKKWRELNRDTYRLLAYRQKSAPVKRLLENVEMPHMWIEKDCSPDEVKNLVNREYREENCLFIVKSVYASLTQPGFLLRVVSSDMDYTQKFYVMLVKEEKGWLVKLDATQQPYRTPAVKLAVWKIGEWLST